MQQRYQLVRVHAEIENQQGAQLRVTILFDNVDDFVLVDELLDRLTEWKRLYTAVIQTDVPLAEPGERFPAGTVAAANRENGGIVEFRVRDFRLRYELASCLPLHQQPVDDFLVIRRVLGIRAVLRVARAAREVRSLGVRPRQRPVRYPVAIDIEVTIERIHFLEIVCR